MSPKCVRSFLYCLILTSRFFLAKLTLSPCVQKASKNLVNLGCGTRFHPDWINIDLVGYGKGVMAHDLSRGIPLPDASCDAVYHSHVLEHVRRDEVAPFLSECRRVLKPGGVLRVVVPDLEAICRLYLDRMERALAGDAEAAADYEWMMLELYDQTVREKWPSPMWNFLYGQPLKNRGFVEQRIGNLASDVSSLTPSSSLAKLKTRFRATARSLVESLHFWKPARALRIGYFRLNGQVHQWMYDRYSLAQLLLRAGFENPVRHTAKSSHIPDWQEYNLDTWPDGSVYKPDSLFMEASKRARG
jgi:SAM-dependent methyltransferase